MVKIIDFKEHVSAKGNVFYSLKLQGGLTMVKSQETGNYYATSNRASIISTFDEAGCKALIGQELPGKVVKVNCEPYTYVVRETGEEKVINSRWMYLPEEVSEEQVVFEGSVESPVNNEFN